MKTISGKSFSKGKPFLKSKPLFSLSRSLSTKIPFTTTTKPSFRSFCTSSNLDPARWKNIKTVQISQIPFSTNPSQRLIPPRHDLKNTVLLPNIPLRILRTGVTNFKTKEGTFKLAVMRTQCNQGKKDLERYLEQLYGIKIRKINTLNYEYKWHRKRFRDGGFKFAKKGTSWKKAYVTFLDPKLSDKKLFETYQRKKLVEMNSEFELQNLEEGKQEEEEKKIIQNQ